MTRKLGIATREICIGVQVVGPVHRMPPRRPAAARSMPGCSVATVPVLNVP